MKVQDRQNGPSSLPEKNWLATRLHKIEMVQRRAARWTLKRYHNTSSVSSMLLDLGWRSLEQRRADSRLTLLYKIHKGHVPIETSKHLRPIKRRFRHSHSNSFIPLSTSISSHRLSFYPRTITQWNNLPQSIFDNDDLLLTFRLFYQSQSCQLIIFHVYS